MNDRPLRVLIVDDEPLARQRLLDLLKGRAEIEVVGQATSGREAVQAIRSLHPDLVFLDVQMPGMTGFDVVREIGPEQMPVTIFVTAYDQYALQAFEVAALDYLLKPFDDERFEQALERARRLWKLKKVEALRDRLLQLLQEDRTPEPARPPKYLERIAVEMRGQVRVIPVRQIDYITASGPYAELHVGDQVYVIREQMQTLEERLDPALFIRIHRSAIVRIDLIDVLLRGAGGRYAVRLKNGVRLKVSRSRREALERRLGLNAE
ncbi:LytR/AlgR family response regulator transcription factor [Rhodothermus profundi]|nr:LytTR family DNA-binding domain-containing protein [Rhodothermus profundi]